MNYAGLKKFKKIHFIGIGGIGVSAIARMMLVEGKKVSGSDNSASEITDVLQKEGAHIFKNQDVKNLESGIDLVVYTAAIPKDNTELLEAQKRNIPILSYSEMLGLVSQNKKVIAVSGTHGKTTTTGMLAEILINVGIDPTVIIGSLLKNPRTNFVAGKGEYFLTEADEYKKSFLSLSPYILVITNIDLDHLDFYKNLSDIQNAFIELVQKIPENGVLVCDPNNPHLQPVIKKTKCKIIDYKSESLDGLKLQVPGVHNKENAQVAVAVSGALGIDRKKVFDSLNAFTGVWRRFDFKGKTKSGALVYDDYAHNPQKVRAVILGAKEMFPEKRIVAVFQPHLYSRTKLFLKDFGESLSLADSVILLPIYGAREKFDSSVSSNMLAREIERKNVYVITALNLEDLKNKLNTDLKDGDVCLLIGAGDIYTIAPEII